MILGPNMGLETEPNMALDNRRLLEYTLHVNGKPLCGGLMSERAADWVNRDNERLGIPNRWIRDTGDER